MARTCTGPTGTLATRFNQTMPSKVILVIVAKMIAILAQQFHNTVKTLTGNGAVNARFKFALEFELIWMGSLCTGQ